MLQDYTLFKINQDLFREALNRNEKFTFLLQADVDYIYELLSRRQKLRVRNIELKKMVSEVCAQIAGVKHQLQVCVADTY